MDVVGRSHHEITAQSRVHDRGGIPDGTSKTELHEDKEQRKRDTQNTDHRSSRLAYEV